MGTLYVSPSEIDTYDLCKRKWAFIYVEGKRPPPNDSAALGSRVHKVLELWLKDGAPANTWEEEGDIAAAGLHLLPPPRYPGLSIEHQFHFTSRRAWYTGVKDFRYRDANGLIHVGDHKTTKSMQWVKTLEEILYHPQALIYAVDEFRQNPNDSHVSLDWIYYLTKGSRRAVPRTQIVDRQTVAELFFSIVDPVAGEITNLHNTVPEGTSALEFEPNFRACEAYGGCPFLGTCNPTPTDRMNAAMTQANLSLTDKLKGLAQQRAAQPSPMHPPEHQAAPPGPPAPQGYVPPPVPPPQPWTPPAPTPPGHMHAPAGQLPFPSPAPAPGYAPTPLETQMAQRFDLPTPQAPAAMPPAPYPPQAVQAPGYPAPPAPAPSAAPAFTPEAPKAPKGSKKVKASSAEVIDDTPATPTQITNVTNITNPLAPAPSEAPAGFVLYIGCAPMGVEVTNALDYVNAAHDQLKETMKVSHYKMIPYGEAQAAISNFLDHVFAQCAQTNSVPTGDVVLGDTQIEQDTAAIWISKAAKVVRGFR